MFQQVRARVGCVDGACVPDLLGQQFGESGGTAPGVERSATRSQWQPVASLAINWPVEPVGPAEPFFGARSEIAVIVFVAVTVRKLLRLA